MNFLRSNFQNMPDVVDTKKSTTYNIKKFKIISFILYCALEGKSTLDNNLSIPQEIIIMVMSFTFKQKVFFHKPVFMKMHQKQIKPNEKIIIRKSQEKGNKFSIKLQKDLFQKQKVSGLFADHSKTFSNKNDSMLFSINIISTWIMKGNESKNQNNLFKKWQYLNSFLKKANIEVSSSKHTQNHQKKSPIKKQKNELKCQLICEDRNLLLHEIQCLKSYERSKIANSTEISKITNLIKKNMIIFTLTPFNQNSNQKLNILLVDDHKRFFYKGQKTSVLNVQNHENRILNKNARCLNFNGMDLNDIPLVFNERTQQWQIGQRYHKYRTTKEIGIRKSQFLCQSGKEYKINEHQLIQVVE